jgi:hypothetical protein
VGEREGERGGMVWHGAAQQCGIGPAAARCHATVENHGVGATRVDVTDRWAGTLRGPGHQRLGAPWGSAVRRLARR